MVLLRIPGASPRRAEKAKDLNEIFPLIAVFTLKIYHTLPAFARIFTLAQPICAWLYFKCRSFAICLPRGISFTSSARRIRSAITSTAYTITAAMIAASVARALPP